MACVVEVCGVLLEWYFGRDLTEGGIKALLYSMSEVTLEDVVKEYGDVRAVDHVSMTIRDGEFVALVGPSGCGKTTTLNMVAGLIELTSGTIAIDGKIVNELDPKDRDIAMGFQNYAPHP